MNYTWRKITSEDFKIVDLWDSEDLREYVTFNREFLLSEYFEMFGDSGFSKSGVALDDDGNIIPISVEYKSGLIIGGDGANENLNGFLNILKKYPRINS